MIKLDNEEIKRRFQSLYNGEYSLIGEYCGNKNPMTIKHNCGHQYTISRGTRFFNGTGGLCPICSKKESIPKTRIYKFTEETIQKRLDAAFPNKYIYISGFTERDKPCTFKCMNCNNQFEVSLHHLLDKGRSRGCPFCNPSKRGYRKDEEPKTYLEDTLAECNDGNEYEWLESFKGSREKHNIRHKTCGHTYSVRPAYFRHGDKIRCPYCARKRSKIEEDFSSEILKICPDAILSDRHEINPYEIDIFIPSKKIGFEFNGLFWHSEKFKGKFYHRDKLNIARKKDIRLVQIFEDEWKQHREIVLSKIKSILGVRSENIIFARKCICKKVTNPKEYMSFLDKNHIQGAISIHTVYGLYYNNKLVAIGGFNKLRDTMSKGNHEGAWDMIRYAADINTTIIGGCSKIISKFVSEESAKYIKTLADLRWSNPDSNMYTKIGFSVANIVEPRYFYSDGSSRLSRFSFRKSEIARKFPEIYDENLTEFQMMDKTKYFRIWDAGKITYHAWY